MKSVVLGMAGILILGLIVLAVGGFFSLDFAAGKVGAEAKTAAGIAMTTITVKQEVSERLGTPIQMGEVKVTKNDMSFFGKSEIQLSIEMTGPKASGHASVTLEKPGRDKPWMLKGGNVFPSNSPPIRISR